MRWMIVTMLILATVGGDHPHSERECIRRSNVLRAATETIGKLPKKDGALSHEILKKAGASLIDTRKIAKLGAELWLERACSNHYTWKGAAAGASTSAHAKMVHRFASFGEDGSLNICTESYCNPLTVQQIPEHTLLQWPTLSALQGNQILHPNTWAELKSRRIRVAAAQLQVDGFVQLQNLLSPSALQVAANFASEVIRANVFPQLDAMTTRHHFVNDTLSRFFQVELTPLVEHMAGVGQLTLAHTYFAGYVEPGSKIPPHRDRPGCELSMSLNVVSTPKKASFPIGVRLSKGDAIDGDVIAFEFNADGWQEVRESQATGNLDSQGNEEIFEAWLEPGDAFLFWGRRLTHFRRRPLKLGEKSLNLLLHWSVSDVMMN